MLKEFREFISKGSVVDLAVGIMIGAAFTAIVNSLVKDIITPIIGVVFHNNFDNLYVVLKQGDAGSVAAGATLAEAQKVPGAVLLTYGNFVNAVINFLLVAFALFTIVKAVNKFRKPAPAPAAPEPAPDVALLTEIRDLLAKRA